MKNNLAREESGLQIQKGPCRLLKDQLTKNDSETFSGSTTWPNHQKPSFYLGIKTPGSAKEKRQEWLNLLYILQHVKWYILSEGTICYLEEE